jgi:hypothetical protein
MSLNRARALAKRRQNKARANLLAKRRSANTKPRRSLTQLPNNTLRLITSKLSPIQKRRLRNAFRTNSSVLSNIERNLKNNLGIQHLNNNRVLFATRPTQYERNMIINGYVATHPNVRRTNVERIYTSLLNTHFV